MTIYEQHNIKVCINQKILNKIMLNFTYTNDKLRQQYVKY